MAKQGDTGRFPAGNAAPKRTRFRGLIVFVAVVLCLGISVAILYPVAREYYVTIRQSEQLQVELAALEQRNSQIQQQVDAMSTPEGVEDRAREEFGWVKEGEQAVNITGLDVSTSSTALPAAVPSGSVVPESSWVTDMLDALFNVEPIQPAAPREYLEP